MSNYHYAVIIQFAARRVSSSPEQLGITGCGQNVQSLPGQFFRFPELRDDNEKVCIINGFTWLTLDQLTLIAGQGTTPSNGEIKSAGRMRMVGGYEADKLVMVLLEFLPDESPAQGMLFQSRHLLRFRDHNTYLRESSNSEWWMHPSTGNKRHHHGTA